MKQVHPDLTMSKRGSQVLNSMVIDMYGKIMEETKQLLSHSKRQTLTSRDIQTAVRLIFPGQLAIHAVSEGTRAVTNAARS
jgi:histone H2B